MRGRKHDGEKVYIRERKSMMEDHEGGSVREETGKEESTWGGIR